MPAIIRNTNSQQATTPAGLGCFCFSSTNPPSERAGITQLSAYFPECKNPSYHQGSRPYKDAVPTASVEGEEFHDKATYSSPPPCGYHTASRVHSERLVQYNQEPSATFDPPTELSQPPTTPPPNAHPGMHSFD